jgi:hypothetical protein
MTGKEPLKRGVTWGAKEGRVGGEGREGVVEQSLLVLLPFFLEGGGGGGDGFTTFELECLCS